MAERADCGNGRLSVDLLDQLLVPAGGLQGPLFASLLRRLSHAPAQLPQGEQFGPYRVLSTLGSGGMATVYLAERVDGEFDQRVALKLVTPGRDAPAARELLRRERQILASLQHPHIARLLDGGTTEDGLLWLAMEPIEGQRIDRYCVAQALSERSRLLLFLQVCTALRFAHARLLVHRDIKPSNILVTADGEAKLLDFGIAAVLQAKDSAGTAPQALTPGYASPEQRRGEAATTASDIWQLGRLLEVLLVVGDAVAGQARPRARADLAAIIAKAKHDDATRRYESVGELALDIERYLERRPVTARQAGWAYRTGLFISRHTWSTSIAGVALLSCAALAWHFTWQLALERDLAANEAARANAATAFLIDQFRVADPGVNRGQSLTAEQILQRATDRLDKDLTDKPALRASLLQAIAKIHLALGETARAQPLIDAAVVALRALQPLDRFALADALQVQGVILLQLGHPVDALKTFQESGTLNDTDTAAARQLRLQTLDVQSMAQIGTGQLDAALATQEKAVAMAREFYGAESLEMAASLSNFGIVLRALGDSAATSAAFAEAWRLYRKAFGADHPQSVGAQKHYALALLDQGEIARAKPLLIEAVEWHRKLYQGRGQIYASAVRGLGALHAAQAEWPEAIRQFRLSESLFREALGPQSLALTYTLHGLGDAYAAQGDAPNALASYQETLAIRRKLMPADHPLIAGSLSASVGQLLLLGRYAEAESAAREAVALFRARARNNDPMLAQSLLRLGAAQQGLGDHATAATTWRESLALTAARYGTDSKEYRDASAAVDRAR